MILQVEADDGEETDVPAAAARAGGSYFAVGVFAMAAVVL